MSGVKRYTTALTLCPSGYVVRAEDYDDLAAANQRLETELAELKAEEPEWSAQMQRLGDDNQRLREALSTAKYRIEQGRVWNGMGWTLTGLHSHGQQQALKAIDAALTTANGEVA
jgi:hypothetical protein